MRARARTSERIVRDQLFRTRLGSEVGGVVKVFTTL